MNTSNLKFYSSLSDLLPDGIVLYDLAKKNVVYINTAAITLTGIQPLDNQKQVMDRWQQVIIQDRAYLSAQFHALLHEPGSRTAEFEIIRDGQQRIFLHATACLEPGEHLLVVVLRDITQLKRHEDYLVEFGIKKNTLLDTLTHNLSGSLNLTRHLANRAEKFADASMPDLQSVLALIRENNEASLKIIDDFLQYEHDSSPQVHIKATRIDVVQKVGFVYEQLRQSYPERKFNFTTAQPELHVTTDEVKLLQAINNLASNAVKFSLPDQPVTIRIDATDQDVIISVADRGIGIPESLKALVFLRQPSTGRAGLNGEASNGKGLSISKQLIEMIKGEIWFESQEQQGTTFFIRLPQTLNPEEQTGQSGFTD